MQLSKYGPWIITRGKGNRYYINCNDSIDLMHPNEIQNHNGAGMYGWETMKQLAVAIQLAEATENNLRSIDAATEKELTKEST